MNRRVTVVLVLVAVVLTLLLVLLAPRGRTPPARPPEEAARAPAAPPVDLTPLPPPVDLALCDRDADLFGTVKAPDGSPIPGARIATESRPWGESLLSPFDVVLRDEVAPGPSTLSSDDGSWRLRLARGEVVDLLVSAGGYYDETFKQRLAGERVDLVLRPIGSACMVEVTLKNGAGAPIAGARLTAYQSRGPLYGLENASGVTGPDGRAVLDRLDEGQVNVQVRADGYASAVFAALLEAGATLRKEVVLEAGRTITGRVTDAESGLPIAKARIFSHGRIDPVLTDDMGRYEWAGFSTNFFGEMNVNPLRCSADGYADVAKQVPIEGNTLDFALVRGGGIAGRVVDDAGRPLAGAMVEAIGAVMPGPGESYFDRRAARTGEDGRFAVSGLSLAISHTLLVRAEGHGRVLVDVPPPPDGGSVFDVGDVTLSAGLSIEGVVVEENGSPVSEIVADLRGGNADRARFSAPPAGLPDAFWCGRLTSRTDDLGRFRFRDLSPGTYRLCVPALEGRQNTIMVNLEPGRSVTDLVVRLPGGPSVTVFVTDPDGKAVAGMPVSCDWDYGWRIFRKTGPDGKATFTGLPDHPVIVTVSPPVAMGDGGFFERSMEVLPANQEVTIPLRIASTIKGIVLDPEGNPLAGMFLRCRRNEGEAAGGSGTTDENGRFSFQAAKGVETSLLVLGARRSPTGLGFEMTPFRGGVESLAAPADLQIRCTRVVTDRRLDLLVLDPDGRPVAKARVTADGQCADLEGVTNVGGQVSFDGLDPDYIWVYVSLERASGLTEDVPVTQYFVLPPDVTSETLNLRRGVWIRGTVLAPDGTPAVGAQIVASTLAGAAETAVADDTGTFAVLSYKETAADLSVRWTAPSGEPCYVFRRGIRPEFGHVKLELIPLPPGAGGGF